MEKALVIDTVRQLKDAEAFDRVYYGSEFCQNLIPGPDEIRRVRREAAARGKALTLLTPPVTNEGIGKLRRALGCLDRDGDGIEVVFNDWGVFSLLREDHARLEPVLGRLLTKQRRDPLAYNVLFDRQAPVRSHDKKSGIRRVYYPKSTPGPVREHFRASVVNVPAFQEYLLKNAVRRVEIDNLMWDMNVRVDKKIGVSLHVPFGYVTTTRLCGLINLTYSSCGKECRKRYLSFRDSESPARLYIAGNTVFYRPGIPPGEYLKEKHIDRLVVTAE